MKDEIKEILDKILLNCDTQEEKNKLLDYITNLREEKDKFKLRCEELENRIRKMEIENNLMKELLSKPVSYTYGIR